MAISLRSILKNVASENYDKGNIAVFLLLNAIYGGLMFSMMANMGNKQTLTALYAIVMLLILVTISGSIGVATHNAINRKKGVFPNIIKDFGLIISTISKAALGGLGVGIILCIVSLIPVFIIVLITGFSAVGIQSIGSAAAGGLIIGYIVCFILMFILSVFMYLLLVSLYLNFIRTLKLSDYFNFKKGFAFLKLAKWKLLILLIVVIVISLIYSVFSQMLITNFLMTMSKTGLTFIGALTTMIQSIFCVYLVEYLAQIVRSTLPKKKVPSKTQAVQE